MEYSRAASHLKWVEKCGVEWVKSSKLAEHKRHHSIFHFRESEDGKWSCISSSLPFFVHLRFRLEIIISIFWLGRRQLKGVLFTACCELLDTVSLQTHHAYLYKWKERVKLAWIKRHKSCDLLFLLGQYRIHTHCSAVNFLMARTTDR